MRAACEQLAIVLAPLRLFGLTLAVDDGAGVRVEVDQADLELPVGGAARRTTGRQISGPGGNVVMLPAPRMPTVPTFLTSGGLALRREEDIRMDIGRTHATLDQEWPGGLD